jgi:hypothetical protein
VEPTAIVEGIRYDPFSKQHQFDLFRCVMCSY